MVAWELKLLLSQIYSMTGTQIGYIHIGWIGLYAQLSYSAMAETRRACFFCRNSLALPTLPGWHKEGNTKVQAAVIHSGSQAACSCLTHTVPLPATKAMVTVGTRYALHMLRRQHHRQRILHSTLMCSLI